MLAGARLLLLVGSAAAFVARGPAPLSPHAPAAARSGAVLAKKKAEEEGLYSDTVSLPQTSFSQRAMAATREPELQQFWSEKRVYERLCETNPGEPFTLHDGPPYANGDLHIGHALNKVLKDVINKYQLLRGRKARFVPGWDCHGLPIELKVLQSMKSKERQALTPIDLRKKAAAFARDTVDKQRASFQRWGVWADWSAPYLTLQPEYEAAQLGVFGAMFLQGHIYRGRKPVHWSPSSRTALAEAELEYPEGHTSQSIYVAFDAESVSESLAPYGPEGLRIAIWTTTPWTIPANLAVAVNANLDYSVVAAPQSAGGGRLLVATELVGSLTSKLGLGEGEALEVVATLKGSELVGTTYTHPLAGRSSMVVEGGDYITTESGTGLVHTAPGHGQEDYQTGLKYGLELLSPVDDAGRFTDEAGDGLAGLNVLGDGNTAVIEKLKTSGNLLSVDPYQHKYPYDWRTKKPTIFRATSQWFASVDGFRDGALAAIGETEWLPAVGERRITAMTQSRSDWCISRQRTWGVPIPVFYDRQTDEPLLNEETLSHVQRLVAEHGTDVWWTSTEAELLPEPYASDAGRWRKGTDTMDVWFDSGSSWASVAEAREGLRYPADLYLEGSDQHRGWFQSSLLTSVASRGQAPYKAVLTHGFVLDEKGFKMSKSLGNVVDPKLITDGGKNLKAQPAYGADVLRLWVASSNYAADVCIGDSIIKQTFEAYRKMRNTARFLLGNLHDFDPAVDAVPLADLPELDVYVLGLLDDLLAEVRAAYDAYSFSRAVGALQQFLVSDLSNFYLDVSKDRLYIAAPDEPRRRSCQTVLSRVVESVAAAAAPVLPHLAEDIYQNLPYATPHASVFEAGWPAAAPAQGEERRGRAAWAAVRSLRDEVNRNLELARAEKALGASLEAKVLLHCADPAVSEALARWSGASNGVDELRFLFLTSQVELVASATEVTERSLFSSTREEGPAATVGIAAADGTKCERCWHFDPQEQSQTYEGVCPRCETSLSLMGVAPRQRRAAAAAGYFGE
mmetsp:Transcript_10182/g.33516  ORF Transcript_10182/g.33516 Transcript_10182/m.33516 type:complete len:1021 (+) Transcript_10182:19-3081(+)